MNAILERPFSPIEQAMARDLTEDQILWIRVFDAARRLNAPFRSTWRDVRWAPCHLEIGHRDFNECGPRDKACKASHRITVALYRRGMSQEQWIDYRNAEEAVEAMRTLKKLLQRAASEDDHNRICDEFWANS